MDYFFVILAVRSPFSLCFFFINAPTEGDELKTFVAKWVLFSLLWIFFVNTKARPLFIKMNGHKRLSLHSQCLAVAARFDHDIRMWLIVYNKLGRRTKLKPYRARSTVECRGVPKPLNNREVWKMSTFHFGNISHKEGFELFEKIAVCIYENCNVYN